MTSPSSTIYVRPGWASSTWSYANLQLPAGAATSTVSAVAFDAASALDQQFTRGDIQYSLDNGKNWTSYALPVDGQGSYVSVSATLWRFQDRLGSDGATPDTFNVHYKLANGSIATEQDTVFADSQPVGLVGTNDVVFSTMHAGDVVDTLLPMDTGAVTGGRWVIDDQSQPGLFAIAWDPAGTTAAHLVVANAAAMPANGQSAAVTVHYYDRYQVGTDGNPAAGTGVARTLTYSIEDGASSGGLAGFGSDSTLGAGAGVDAWSAQPALATLSGGGFVAVWQGMDAVAGGAGTGAGAGLWAQLRDAGGNARGAAFALTPDGDANIEGQPAVAALGGGRFVVAYPLNDGAGNAIAYRVVDAAGRAGAEHVLDTGAGGDAAMPTVAALADGSVVVGWRSASAVHVQALTADGVASGPQQVYGALGSAYSPALAALSGGGYVVAWGEMNDGNVYAAPSKAPAAVFIASGDGYAASIATAAPLPHVTALADGGFVVAWDSYVNDPRGFSISDIFFQRYDGAGHAQGGSVQANVESGGGRYDAAVTTLSDGSFLVAWQGSDDDGNGIYGRRFGADGTPLDTQEFALNEMRAGDQTGPAVIALAGGGFAGAWVDSAADGSVNVEARVLNAGTAAVAAVTAAATVPAADSHTGSAAETPAGATAPVAPASHAADSAPAVAHPAPPAASAPAVSVPVTTAPVNSAPVASAPAATAAPVKALTFGSDGHMLAAVAGESTVSGTGGLDTLVYAGARAGTQVVVAGGAVSVTDGAGNHALLAGVERLQFSDGMVALDIDGAAGDAYRLYQAAFDRAPDKAGLGYWIGALDHGMTLDQAASSFTGSAEFHQLYGANASDAQFVRALYANVLHRPAEGAGYDFWVDALHATSRADVLANFSGSGENRAQVIGSIEHGIDYQHWG
jgi:hypothetical protein